MSRLNKFIQRMGGGDIGDGTTSFTFKGRNEPVETDNVVHVRSQSDLPSPSGGTISLNASTGYKFSGFVTIDTPIELGSLTPLTGTHGGLDGIVYSGSGALLRGTDAELFADNLLISAPNATVFDLTADNSTEMLVESVSFADPLSMGDQNDLGTIDGYRVPTFKGCNFEDFDSGLTLTGNPDKVFFSTCPFRTVDASNVTVITFDSSFEADVIDMSNNYFKSVQSDTEIVHVDPSATINEIFQYRGNTHDSSVTESNILTGQAGIDVVGYRVSDSYPLSNSKSFIDYTLDSETTTTISTQAASKTDEADYVKISGSTTERGSARFTHSNNSATYNGKRNRVASLTATVSLGTGTDDEIAVAWFVNGSLVPGTETRVQMNQQGGGVAKTVTSSGVDGEIDTNDTFDVRVANLGSATNITVGELNAKITT